MSSMQDFFDEKIRLPSPPVIALKILKAVRNDENSFEELAEIISVDPALSIRILKIANSSLYGFPKPVDSLAKATGLIGTEALKNIALSFVIVQDFQDVPQGGFDLDLFWRRAVTAAVAAEVLGRNIGSKGQDFFVSGLLQDIGVMILFLSSPNEYTMVLDDKRISAKNLCDTEKQQFGRDHAEIGYHLLSSWMLPASISKPIRSHHSVGEEKEFSQEAKILNFADKISAMYHGLHSNSKFVEIHKGLSEEWRLSTEEIDALIDSVGEQSREVMELFSIDPGEIKPFTQIMQEANDELRRLNFSYEQIVLELKQAKQSAEQLAGELKRANESLRELALRDGLTGLYNHRYFQEILEVELNRGLRYEHPLSLLLIDIDFFKKVNDLYGHPAGDHVLRAVSRLLVKLVRHSDIVARYGGEEFAVIMPETGSRGARVIAQRLRRGIGQEQIDYKDQSISVTISIGLATSDGNNTSTGRKELIELSDRALYRAKQNGRNRIEG
jgi:diguanylate cyclase (GGDEF)-like protein